MEFRTIVDIEKAVFQINPTDRMLFVGSCFAENIGRRFADNQFHTVVNPFGTMYNPASILHTVAKTDGVFDVAVFTLGTNHVYILKETGEIVDNCQKRPQRLFQEKELTVEECTDYLQQAVDILRQRNPEVKVVITVSPIRYAKYGYHGSQLSKATLLLAANNLITSEPQDLKTSQPQNLTTSKPHNLTTYFPAYEIVNDELRDYRFYQADMLHPSEQAVEYIYERFAETFFSKEAKSMVSEWQPIKHALAHKPFDAENPEYKKFLTRAQSDRDAFIRKWGI